MRAVTEDQFRSELREAVPLGADVQRSLAGKLFDAFQGIKEEASAASAWEAMRISAMGAEAVASVGDESELDWELVENFQRVMANRRIRSGEWGVLPELIVAILSTREKPHPFSCSTAQESAMGANDVDSADTPTCVAVVRISRGAFGETVQAQGGVLRALLQSGLSPAVNWIHGCVLASFANAEQCARAVINARKSLRTAVAKRTFALMDYGDVLVEPFEGRRATIGGPCVERALFWMESRIYDRGGFQHEGEVVCTAQFEQEVQGVDFTPDELQPAGLKGPTGAPLYKFNLFTPR